MSQKLLKSLVNLKPNDLREKSSADLSELLSRLRQATELVQQVYATQVDRERLVKERRTPEEIKRENEELKDRIMCVKCKQRKRVRLLLPCAHLATCAECLGDGKECPICRSAVKGIVSVWET